LGRQSKAFDEFIISRNWWYFPHKYSSYLN
jgi:hypothetical protein